MKNDRDPDLDDYRRTNYHYYNECDHYIPYVQYIPYHTKLIYSTMEMTFVLYKDKSWANNECQKKFVFIIIYEK